MLYCMKYYTNLTITDKYKNKNMCIQILQICICITDTNITEKIYQKTDIIDGRLYKHNNKT